MTTFINPLARWNSRFSAEGYLFGESPNAYLAEMTPSLKAGKTLSLADGEGRNSVWLAKQGLDVDAFDFSPVAIQKAQQLADKHAVKVNYRCSDWESFDWAPDRYDNVVGVFFQFVNPAARSALFAKMDLALKPGGVLLIQGYGKDQLQYKTGGPRELDHLYDDELLLSAFSNYSVLDIKTYTAEVDEGAGHKGMSALVGFVAQKR
ncbi:MAG: class I SAM-dependent methyltransferase [Polaromonas sp.]|nr:class I SAM-dependent methyltransferase [Polaromonas sp.]